MSPRHVTPESIADLDQKLFAPYSAIAMVPVGEAGQWAADCTWAVARAAAARGRRVALIDLSLEQPALDSGAKSPPGEGIVDAFLYGASLSRIAAQQDPGNLYYLAVGTSPADPAEVLSSQRWTRLVDGFRTEKALLLAFVPPSYLPHCAFEPDGVIVLSPSGFEAADGTLPGLGRWLSGPASLIAVVADEVGHEPAPAPPEESVHFGPLNAAPPPPPPAEEERPASPPMAPAADRTSPQDSEAAPQRPVFRTRPTKSAGTRTGSGSGNRRFLVLAGIAVILVLGGMVGWPVIRDILSNRSRPAPPSAAVSEPMAQTEVAAPPIEAALPDTLATQPEAEPAVAPPPQPDSLFYGIQVAAFNTVTRAMEHANALSREGLVPAVTPVRIGGGLWFRVIMGAFSTRAAADSTLLALWREGTVEDQQGTAVRTPHTLDVGLSGSLGEAEREAEGLRQRGVPAYVLTAPDGPRVVVGAFRRPDQTGAAESLLTAAGLTATLAQRLGIKP